jgi:hypothetical protein
MFKRRVLAAATLGATVAAGGAIAQAAARHHVSQTVKLLTISQSSTYPNPGSTATDVGTFSGSLGRGAIIQKTVITGHPTLTTYTFKGTSTGFFAHGTTRSAFTGTATAQANGDLTVSGHGHYTGGTGRYVGARGKWSFSGTAPPPAPGKPTPLVGHVTGTIRY